VTAAQTSLTAAPAATAPAPGAARPLSITDFITDGSLAALCEEVTRLTGVRVCLRDPEGRALARATEAPYWRYDGQEECARATAGGAVVVPLEVEGREIGSMVLAPGDPKLPETGARESLERALTLLGRTAGELVRQQIDLKHRVKEVQALYRLSSLLARATDVDQVLNIALELALDVLDLDAGSVVLFEQDEGPTTQTEVDLVLKASRNLSHEWLDCPLPLSKDRIFDRLALSGEVVTSRDLARDDRVFIPEMVEQEGLRGAVHAGMLFQDRAIGVVRLYKRAPREFGDAEKRLLKSVAHQAAVAVEQARLLKLQEREARVQRQVELAADVQRRMFPRRLPALPRLDIAARYQPTFVLSGDFYDFVEMGASLGLAIGDVVGKGLAAALMMSGVRASLRAHVQDVYHIDEVLARVNAALARDTLDNEFVTLWYGVIDAEKLRLTYCSGGHEPPLVFRATPGRAPGMADIDELSVGGMALGIDPTQRYQRGTYDLRAGDVVLLYTDGVTDVQNFDGKKFGKNRLRAAVLGLLTREPQAAAARVVEHVFWELRQFGGIRERPDDQTVVVVRVKE
jgi:sigma-B regulation protein RsbU (phosphoserine phosphatase)